VSHDFSTVPIAEITKIFCVNDLPLEPASLDDSALQQSTVNPLLHLVRANMQPLRQGVFRAPILAHP
jgi:hypothetical protein